MAREMSEYTSIVSAVRYIPAYFSHFSGLHHPSTTEVVATNLTYRDCIEETEYDSGHTLHTANGELYATYAGVHIGWLDADGHMLDISTKR